MERFGEQLAEHALRVWEFFVWYVQWDYVIESLIIGGLMFMVIYWLSDWVKALCHNIPNTLFSFAVLFLSIYGIPYLISVEGFGVLNTKWFWALLFFPPGIFLMIVPKKDNRGHGTFFQRFGNRG